MGSTLLTLDEVSDRTRLPVATLRYFRTRNEGPASFRLGRRVLYRETDVEEWIDAQMQADANRRRAGAA